MANLNPQDIEFLNNTTRMRQNCAHNFIGVNWIVTDRSKNASQLMCSKCMMLVTMQEVATQNARYTGLAAINEQMKKENAEKAKAEADAKAKPADKKPEEVKKEEKPK